MLRTSLFIFLLAIPSLAYIPATKPLCDQCAENDIIFVIDSSESISESNYQTELNFIQSILSNSKSSVPSWGQYIGYNVLVGVIIFDTTPWGQQGFIDNYNYDAVNSYLQSVSNYRTQGTSNLCAALNVAFQWFDQSSSEWGRSKVPKTLVIFTDGDPNNAPGTCTSSTFVSACGSMKAMGVEILTIAVSGSNGNQPASNYPLLQQCASIVKINGSMVDLTYNVTDASSLYNIENSITSRMGCCSCFPDVAITAEMSEYTAGTSNYLYQMYTTINRIFSTLCQHGVSTESFSVYNGLQPSDTTATVIKYNQCDNYMQIEQQQCPRATCGTGCDNQPCKWEAGLSDLHAGLMISNAAIKQQSDPSRPNATIFMSTGACDSGNEVVCNNQYIMSSTIADYQSRFAFRIGEVLNVGGSATDKVMMEKIIGCGQGDQYTFLIDGPGSDSNRTGDCISYQLFRWLSDQPGCSMVAPSNYNPCANNANQC